MTETLPGGPLTGTDYDELARSWITPWLADRALLRRVTDPQGKELVGGRNRNCEGVAIPYVRPSDDRVYEYRLRRDKPEVEYKDGKPRPRDKYLSPPGRNNLLYFFPDTPPEWLQDVTLPVVITEGEKKAIALWRLAWHGAGPDAPRPLFLPIALPGVYNWRGKIGKEPAANGGTRDQTGVIAAMSWVEWAERRVVIFFDANVRTNRMVREARDDLARYLKGEEAAVYYANLPERPGENGADEMLAAVGPRPVLQLLDRAQKAKVKPEEASQAERLLEIQAEAELFQASDQKAYATFPKNGHHETWAVDLKPFKLWLRHRYYAETGKGLSDQAVNEAIQLCEARAQVEGAVRSVPIRVAQSEGAIYLDLGQPEWNAVQVTPQGWEVVASPPVKFRRAPGFDALPTPERGGSLEPLRPLVNAQEREAWVLMLAWLVGAFMPEGPYPILVLQAGAGSGKSTTSRLLRSLIDPSVIPMRSSPKDDRDLSIAANNSWVVALDNLSGVPAWLSDGLCRLSTGGGFATRKLTTDSEEVLFMATRPMIVNGIDDITGREDLASRAIVLPLTRPAVPRPIKEVDAEFERLRPRLLGALLEAVRTAQARLSSVRLSHYPRMADFARWVVAACPALPFDEQEFLDAYSQNQSEGVDLAVNSSLFASAVRRLAREQGPWAGTADELLAALQPLVPVEATRTREWPGNARALGNRIRRSLGSLRGVGVEVGFSRHKRERLITIATTLATGENNVTNVTNVTPMIQVVENKQNSLFEKGDVTGDVPKQTSPVTSPRTSPATHHKNQQLGATGDVGDVGDVIFPGRQGGCEGVPQGACYACGGIQYHQKKGTSHWVCSRCHPPSEPPGQVREVVA